MVNVVERFSDKAKEILENSEKDWLFLMLDKQYDLLLNIIESKNLYNKSIKDLTINTALSIYDEMAEYIDIVLDNNLDEEKRTTEALFEIIDAIHFVMQLHFLSTAQYYGYSIDSLQKQDVRNVIINNAINSIKFFGERGKPYMKTKDRETIYEIYSMINVQISTVLSNVHWKLWKNYKEFNYYKLIDDIATLFYMLVFNFGLICQDRDYESKLVEYYIIKNIENFDRQERGY